jgi:hypothetical protein
MRKPESSIKMSTAKLVQLTIGGNFQYSANMWPTSAKAVKISDMGEGGLLYH